MVSLTLIEKVSLPSVGSRRVSHHIEYCEVYDSSGHQFPSHGSANVCYSRWR